MAVTQNTLIGSSKNKVGGTVMSRWKGRNTLRAKPLTVGNPNTIPQQNQRARMTLIVAIGQFLLAMIKYGWQEFKSTNSQWALYIKANIEAATTASGGVASFVPANFKVASGSLIGFENLVITDNGSQALNITADDNSGIGNALASDKLQVVAHNQTTDVWITDFDVTTRSNINWDSPTLGIPTNVVRVYIFMTDQFHTKESDSVASAAFTLMA